MLPSAICFYLALSLPPSFFAFKSIIVKMMLLSIIQVPFSLKENFSIHTICKGSHWGFSGPVENHDGKIGVLETPSLELLSFLTIDLKSQLSQQPKTWDFWLFLATLFSLNPLNIKLP